MSVIERQYTSKQNDFFRPHRLHYTIASLHYVKSSNMNQFIKTSKSD